MRGVPASSPPRALGAWVVKHGKLLGTLLQSGQNPEMRDADALALARLQLLHYEVLRKKEPVLCFIFLQSATHIAGAILY